VAELAPSEIPVNRLAREFKTCGNPLNDAGESGAVALAGGNQSDWHSHHFTQHSASKHRRDPACSQKRREWQPATKPITASKQRIYKRPDKP
jgi:hypothetical protein